MKYLTPIEAAKRLSISPATVRAMCRAGRLRHVRVGTGSKRPLIRIPADALGEIEQVQPPADDQDATALSDANDYLETWR